MNLELALECLREKRLPYKSQFENKKFLTGIFDFDAVLGGFSPDKKYLIVGQYSCFPLLFCNLIIDNIAFLNRKSFKDIASFIRPKLMDFEKNEALALEDLDDELIKKQDVIITVYRPGYYGLETRADGTSTENQIDFKVIKGAEYPQVSGRLSIDFEARNIFSLSLLPYKKFIAKDLKTFNHKNFENTLNSFIKQVVLKDVSQNLRVHFEKNYKHIYGKIKNKNAQLVYLNEPNPTLIGYKTNPDEKNFTHYLKPDYWFMTLVLNNIQNLIALYFSPSDFEVFYRERNRVYTAPVIQEILEKTNNWILYQFQLENILKAYSTLNEVDIEKLIKDILENNKAEIEFLDKIYLENGLGLLGQINQLLLPSRMLYEPNLLVAQKILNFIKLNNI